MSFHWGSYLDLAKFLTNNKEQIPDISQEAILRCAVSRAYYAAFCHARDYAIQKLGYTRDKSSNEHSSVRRCYEKDMADIANKLEQLHGWRKTCDYETQPIFNPMLKATNAIREADNLIKRLKI